MDIIVEITGAGGATNLQALTDVDTSGATSGQVLTYNGTRWVPTAAAGVTTLAALDDTNVAGIQDGEYLVWNATTARFEAGTAPGGSWGSITGTLSAQTDLQTALDAKANTVHSHVKADITDFNDADYATAAQGALAATAVQPGANVSSLVNDAGYITSIPSSALNDLTDVDTVTVAPLTGQVLKFNGTQWVPGNDDTSSGGGGSISELNDLNNVNVGTATLGDFLYYNGTTWLDKAIIKADITDFNESDYATSAQGLLANTAVQPGANVSSLVNDAGYLTTINLNTASDVTITSPTAGQVLKYNGTTWVDGSVDYSELTGVPTSFTPAAHTHSTVDITDLSSYTGLDVRYYTETEVNTLLSNKADTVHTHVKADITDFSDADYATAAQGALAVSALQNLVEDTTPQLGGNLDTNGFSIINNVAVNINGEKLYSVTASTTSATPVNAVSIPLTLGKRITFSLQGSATDSATGDTFGFLLSGCARNHAGTSALAGGTVLTEFKDVGATTWTITAIANDTTDNLEIQITGEAAHNLSWGFVLRTVEI